MPVATILVGAIVLAFLVVMVRRRRINEKYTLLWLAVCLVVAPLALFPRASDLLATRIGVASGVSLVLFIGVVFLLLVSAHLTWETSRLEDRTRALAEQIALLRMTGRDHDDQRAADDR